MNVKHGGGHVMVWGCFAAEGVGSLEFMEGITTANSYIQILKKNLRQSVKKLGLSDSFSFYQDNDPKHKAHSTRAWLSLNLSLIHI